MVGEIARRPTRCSSCLTLILSFPMKNELFTGHGIEVTPPDRTTVPDNDRLRGWQREQTAGEVLRDRTHQYLSPFISTFLWQKRLRNI